MSQPSRCSLNIQKLLPDLYRPHFSLLFSLLITLNMSIVGHHPATLPADMYDHALYLLTADLTTSGPIPNSVQNLAYHQNKLLSTSQLFNTKLISDSASVQAAWERDATHTEITITTSDQVQLTCSYFNRQQRRVLVICPGHSNAKEKMAPFVHMFPDYDLLLVNFRGLGYEPYNFHPVYLALGFTGAAGFGQREHLDVQAAVTWLRQQTTVDGQPRYQQITGLGICLGAYVLARAQALNPALFDQLILDGCWVSLEHFIDKLIADPQLIMNPQVGGAGALARQVAGRLKAPVLQLLNWGWAVKFDGSSDLRPALQQISIPLLLFYGKDDKLITRAEFTELWQNLPPHNHQRFVIITDKPHVHNHLTLPYFYKLACEQFMQNPANLASQLHDSATLTQTLAQQLTQQATTPIDHVFKPKKLTLKTKQNWATFSVPLALGLTYY